MNLAASVSACILCFAVHSSLGAEAGGAADVPGELIFVKLASAPFPHPQRANGHKHKEEFFSAKDHYSDSTVGIFIPKEFRATGRIDCVVHFHGWKNHVAEVLRQYQLAEQLVESRRNAILIVPQGPRDASDSFGGKLEDPDGFKHFMTEVFTALREKSLLTNRTLSLGRIILSGHSGGYQVISSILEQGGLTDRIQEVWLFDGLYARTDKFLAWSSKGQGRFINLYTDRGGTKAETDRMISLLKEKSTKFLNAESDAVTAADLRTNRMIFLHTQLGHNDVLHKAKAFRDFLATSCLDASNTTSPR